MKNLVFVFFVIASLASCDFHTAQDFVAEDFQDKELLQEEIQEESVYFESYIAKLDSLFSEVETKEEARALWSQIKNESLQNWSKLVREERGRWNQVVTEERRVWSNKSARALEKFEERDPKIYAFYIEHRYSSDVLNYLEVRDTITSPAYKKYLKESTEAWNKFQAEKNKSWKIFQDKKNQAWQCHQEIIKKAWEKFQKFNKISRSNGSTFSFT